MFPVLKSIFSIILICLIILFLQDCQNTNYYSLEEGNVKILKAYSIKDISCGTSHTVTRYLVGNSYKNDVDSCLSAINAKSCSQWNVSDPTPRECMGINTKGK